MLVRWRLKYSPDRLSFHHQEQNNGRFLSLSYFFVLGFITRFEIVLFITDKGSYGRFWQSVSVEMELTGSILGCLVIDELVFTASMCKDTEFFCGSFMRGIFAQPLKSVLNVL